MVEECLLSMFVSYYLSSWPAGIIKLITASYTCVNSLAWPVTSLWLSYPCKYLISINIDTEGQLLARVQATCPNRNKLMIFYNVWLFSKVWNLVEIWLWICENEKMSCACNKYLQCLFWDSSLLKSRQNVIFCTNTILLQNFCLDFGNWVWKRLNIVSALCRLWLWTVDHCDTTR